MNVKRLLPVVALAVLIVAAFTCISTGISLSISCARTVRSCLLMLQSMVSLRAWAMSAPTRGWWHYRFRGQRS